MAKAKSYDVTRLRDGINWVLPDGTERREEAGATGITDLPPDSIREMLKSGIIVESAGKGRSRKAVAAGPPAERLAGKSRKRKA